MDLDYVLPLRWSDDAGLEELTGYLRRLARHAHVIVVDGSARLSRVRAVSQRACQGSGSKKFCGRTRSASASSRHMPSRPRSS